MQCFKGSFILVRGPQWTVVLPQRDRKFSISALMQSTAESSDCCERALTLYKGFLERGHLDVGGQRDGDVRLVRRYGHDPSLYDAVGSQLRQGKLVRAE